MTYHQIKYQNVKHKSNHPHIHMHSHIVYLYLCILIPTLYFKCCTNGYKNELNKTMFYCSYFFILKFCFTFILCRAL